MQVHAAVIPPPAVLEAVAAVVRSVPEPAEAVPVGVPDKGIRGRLGRRRGGDELEPTEHAAMLEQVPVEQMRLPITGFGNLTSADAHSLVEMLVQASSAWAPPTICFAGGTALDFPGDWSVWARLDGDVDALSEIARGVTQAVESLGYFVDRRQFRPMLAVATVTTATTGPFLQQVVDALEAFRGEEWTAEISLTKETFVGSRPDTVEFKRISLG